MTQQEPPTHAAPLGQEWEILNKATSYRPEEWADLMKDCRQRIEEVRKRDIVIRLTDAAGNPLANRAVRAVQTSSDFLWGFGGWGILNQLRDGSMAREDVARRAHHQAKLFNSVNLLHYWVEKHCTRAPSSEEYQGFPDYQNIQQGVDWALANNLVPKGHPIFWPVPKAIPQWLCKYDAETRMKFLEIRVRTLTARFRGKMKLYDAVNEMLWEPTLATVEQRHWPHITPVEQMVEYIEPILRWAKEEDPDARYLLNDYGIQLGHSEEIPVVANDGSRVTRDRQTRRYQELVLALKERDAAPDAVGIQGFFGGWGHHDQDLKTLDFLGTDTGLPVMITEFGGSGQQIKAMEAAGASPDQIMEQLTRYVENVLVTCFSHPSVEGFYFWYLGEWFYNKAGHPSAFYNHIHDLIHRQWRTNLSLHTDADGQLRFRGFCGRYQLRLEGARHPRSVEFHVPERSRGQIRLEMVLT